MLRRSQAVRYGLRKWVKSMILVWHFSLRLCSKSFLRSTSYLKVDNLNYNDTLLGTHWLTKIQCIRVFGLLLNETQKLFNIWRCCKKKSEAIECGSPIVITQLILTRRLTRTYFSMAAILLRFTLTKLQPLKNTPVSLALAQKWKSLRT